MQTAGRKGRKRTGIKFRYPRGVETPAELTRPRPNEFLAEQQPVKCRRGRLDAPKTAFG